MQSAINRNRLSSWLLMGCLMILSIGFFVVEFMQIPVQREKELNQYRILIKQEILKDIVQLKLKNKVGEFELSKNPSTGLWYITSPRQLPASNNAIKTIFTMLESIRVLKLFGNEPINRSNFSLDTPYLSVKMSDSQKVQYNIDFGLINPIDGTSYIFSSDTNQIYHIDAIDTVLASMDLNDIVDGRVFVFAPNMLSSAHIYRVFGGSKKLQHAVIRQDSKWIDQNNATLATEAVQEYLTELSSIKSTLILDSINETNLAAINAISETLQYEIVIKDIDENNHEFTVSIPATKNFPDYKIEKNKSLLIKAKNSKILYVLNRDLSKVLNISLAGQKELSIKKLFY